MQNTLQLQTIIIINAPFKIYYKVSSQQLLYIYIRGYKIQFVFHRALPKIIDTINSGRAQPISLLAQKLLLDWEDDAVLYFFETLLNYGGIEVIPIETLSYQ